MDKHTELMLLVGQQVTVFDVTNKRVMIRGKLAQNGPGWEVGTTLDWLQFSTSEVLSIDGKLIKVM